MTAKTFKRGRYSLLLWSPISLTLEPQDEDGWRWVGWAWTWRRPQRWRFPHDGRGGTNRPVIMQGVRVGPVDFRRVSR